MPATYATLIGWGHYLPRRVVTNDELAQTVDTSDAWIRSRSGIRTRHFAAEGETTSSLCTEASKRALARAGIEAGELDLVVVSSSTPDYRIPPVSCQVQEGIGARCGALTIGNGCAGWVYALITAEQFIRSGMYRTVLVAAAEAISPYLNMSNRATCVLFGDGAGAAVLRATEAPCGTLACELGSDGAGAEAIICRASGSAVPLSQRVLDEGLQYTAMDGAKVYRFATRTVSASLARVSEAAGVPLPEVELFLIHQANVRILDHVADALEIDRTRVVVNLDRYGNTSSASIPIALSEALEAGRARPGDRLAFAGFGTGLAWATTLFELGPFEA